MTQQDWDTLSELLVKAADQPFPTWGEKQQEMDRKLSQSGKFALLEIISWGWEEKEE